MFFIVCRKDEAKNLGEDIGKQYLLVNEETQLDAVLSCDYADPKNYTAIPVEVKVANPTSLIPDTALQQATGFNNTELHFEPGQRSTDEGFDVKIPKCVRRN